MTQSHGQNDMRFEDAIKRAKEFADDNAAGNDSLPNMFIHLLTQAADGVFDTEPNKHGKGIDDAKFVFGVYADRREKKTKHAIKGDSLKAQTSKWRSMIKWGLMTTCDPKLGVERVDQAYSAQFKVDPKSVKALSHALVAAATLQQACDTDLTDEQIKACILKADPKEQTVESKLTAAKKILDDLIAGEGGLKDQDPLTVTARTAITDRLAAFTLERETAADQAEILRLEAKGYKLTPTGESAAHSALEVDRGLVTDEMLEAAE